MTTLTLNQPFTFQGEALNILVTTYKKNGNTALSLERPDGNPFGLATVNIGTLPSALVTIKNYSENEGMVEALQEHGIIESTPINTVSNEFVSFPIYRLAYRVVGQMEDKGFFTT